MDTSSKRSRKLPAIPEDIIIIDILLKLPLKSLVRLKSVCKTWYNSINSPGFISMHHNLGPIISHLLICTGIKHHKEEVHNNNHVFSFRYNDKSGKESSPDLEIPASRDHVVYFAGSCNGIVCFFDCSPAIFLSNPATREFKQLPPTSINNSDVELLQIGIGFGFHSSNIYDFKVLRVFDVSDAYADPKLLRAEIFTLGSNSWKEIEGGLDKRYIFINRSGLFCANSFHFLVAGSMDSWDEDTIVCCDIHTERLTTMDLPSKDYNVVSGNFVSLMVVKEFLPAVFSHEDNCIEIWIMKVYGVVESWSKFYSIEPSFGFANPLCFWMYDHALLLFQHEKKELITCNLNKSSLHSEPVVTHGYNRLSQFVIFKETLVSIMSQSLQFKSNL